jgi:hypothetical protein
MIRGGLTVLKFWSKPGAKPLSEKLSRLLVQERGLTTQVCGSLRMLEETGNYVDRKVTFFRVFDPAAITGSSQPAVRFSDLNPATILYYGHTEKNGDLILNAGNLA